MKLFCERSQANSKLLASCSCLPNFVNTDPANPAQCECGPGFGFDIRQGICSPCSKGTYKADAGDTLCLTCPERKSTLELGSKSADDCLCAVGFKLANDSCIECPPSSYCNGTGLAYSCTEGASSAPRSGSVDECSCEAGFFQQRSLCKLCPSGRYKSLGGNDASCPLQCPTSSSSKNGSTDRSECFCLPGFYAELQEGSLSRCVSCETFSTLRCPGGFQDNSSLHQLPVAMPGYFQTGLVTAFKCNVILDDGHSACIGGGFCTEKTCFGKYDNACEEGAVGFLCGECPPGWARTGFQAPCQECQDSTLQLIGSILVDVVSKATISFVITSMAATAAIKGTSKLHTIMIRTTTHWLAACSVITTFDMGQIPLLFWEEQSQDTQDTGNLPWPAEITIAMRRFFAELSLTPALVSLDFSAQCHAQHLFPDQSAAPRVALGIYYLCLPVLVFGGIVLLAWLAVNVLVPVAARFGRFFNEVAKQEKALQERQQRLHDAAEEAPPSQLACRDQVGSIQKNGSLFGLRS